jgi:hypothetical protein
VFSVTPRPRFTHGERTPSTHWTGGWVGLRAGLDAGARRKILCPCQGSNLDHPIVQTVVRHYTAWAAAAPLVSYIFLKSCLILICFAKINSVFLVSEGVRIQVRGFHYAFFYLTTKKVGGGWWPEEFWTQKQTDLRDEHSLSELRVQISMSMLVFWVVMMCGLVGAYQRYWVWSFETLLWIRSCLI